jgi:hypothetical protein
MALCAVSRNLPSAPPGPARVSHRTRSAPLSPANDSVCELPRPPHDPMRRQMICGSAFAGVVSRRHAATALRAATTSAATMRRAMRWLRLCVPATIAES